jgi:hypothetical protein
MQDGDVIGVRQVRERSEFPPEDVAAISPELGRLARDG